MKSISSDRDECATLQSQGLLCSNGATCVNEVGNFKCQCTHGWAGRLCTYGKYAVLTVVWPHYL